ISARRTRAKRQRKAHRAVSGQLHSRPWMRAWGYSPCSAFRPAPSPQPASTTCAPSGSGAFKARPFSARAGGGNSGASRQVLSGYSNNNSASGTSQIQPGSAPAAPVASKESGKPPSMNARRQGVRPVQAGAPETSSASTNAATTPSPAARNPTKTTQASAQVSSAGRGQISMVSGIVAAAGSGFLFGRQGLQRRVATHTGGDPAPRQPAQQRRSPAPARTEQAFGIADRTAAVQRLGIAPAQRVAGTRAFSRDQLAQRAGLGQAAHAAAVAGHARRGLEGRCRVDVDDLMCHPRRVPHGLRGAPRRAGDWFRLRPASVVP